MSHPKRPRDPNQLAKSIIGMRRSVAWIPRADGAGAISVECVSQKNAYAEEYKHCCYDLSHHLAPKFAMPDRELLRTSR